MRTILTICLLLAGCSTPVELGLSDSTLDSVVKISNPETQSHGSGFAIAPHFVVTNAHVVDSSGKTPMVTHSTGRVFAAQPIHVDRDVDIAVLFVRPSLSTVATIRCERPARGERVFVAGFPLRSMWAVHHGHIASSYKPDMEDGAANEFVVIDVGVNSGNSGGPVFDRNGLVVGVIAATMAQHVGFGIVPSSSGLAIPGDVLCRILSREGFR